MSEPLSLASPMPTPSDGLWARLAHTPLLDALRGRVNARLDARRAIAVELTEPLAGLTWLVVRRTRLRREEKLEVARELAGHFRDGLEAGRSATDLAGNFGDPMAAARLIRRAKLRARPWRNRVARRMLQAFGLLTVVLIAAYLGLALRYSLSQPTIGRDYVAELNAASQAAPEADRAWPMYRQALMELKKPDANLQTSDVVASPLPSEGHPAWEAIRAYARGNPGSLRLTREGATRPRLGFIYDPRDAMLRQALGRDALPSAPSDGPLLNLLLPHILELGNLRLLLWADASRALAEGDRPSLLADVRALLGLANQLHEPRTIWADYFLLSNLSVAPEIVGQVLDERPELFTDSDLRDLAHEFAGFADGGSIRMSTDGQRMMFHDLVQRMYTDDGSEDGYLTARGLRLIQDLGGLKNSRSDGTLVSLIGPGLTVAIAGRREMIAQADRLFDQLERERRRPLWTGGESQYEKEFRSMHDSKATAIRYLPVLLILPNIQGVAAEREYAACSTQRRDALLGALALTLFRRHHGAWPATLDELTPSLLPAVPIDHFTGKPLRYRTIEGRPVLYSAGRNRVDDAGTTTRDDELHQAGQPPRADPSFPDDADDWILWRAR